MSPAFDKRFNTNLWHDERMEIRKARVTARRTIREQLTVVPGFAGYHAAGVAAYGTPLLIRWAVGFSVVG